MSTEALAGPKAVDGAPVMRGALAGPWLFAPAVDIGVFLGSAIASLAAVWLGAALGVLNGDTPGWAWVPAVLLIDVAHVWATAFRVYFDPRELRRRRLLYTLVPIVSWVAGVALYVQGEDVFWRTVAYLAIFHFVRQQYGWVALYRARAGERDRLGRWIDMAAIYLATLYPLIEWHAHLPRRFFWFAPYPLASLPPLLARITAPLYVTALAVYALRAMYLWWIVRRPNPGKDIVVATTAVCWYVGIVAFNSDYAFTVTNVIIHGVPYFALVFWYWQRQQPAAQVPGGRLRLLVLFLATLWLLAYIEEMVWHSWLFVPAWQETSVALLLTPLLAVPQLTHYVLDGFIWRRRGNPGFTLVR